MIQRSSLSFPLVLPEVVLRHFDDDGLAPLRSQAPVTSFLTRAVVEAKVVSQTGRLRVQHAANPSPPGSGSVLQARPMEPKKREGYIDAGLRVRLRVVRS